MTEWNFNGGFYRSAVKMALNSEFAKGLGAASSLHAIMKDGDVICLATQSNLVGCGWDIAAIHADPAAKFQPYMRPSGMATMMYSQHHGSNRIAVDIKSMPHYDQPYQMGSFDPKSVAYLDVVATKSHSSLFVHMINRRFEAAQPVEIDTSAFKLSGAKASLYIMEGRLENKAPDGSLTSPSWIRQEKIEADPKLTTIQLPARSIVILELPLQKE
jgi:alpha-L-arabinofuranosidase